MFIEFISLVEQCAPTIDPIVMEAIVTIESNYNPYAIGVVGGYLERQPKTKREAISAAKKLEREGYNFSMGLSQVNYFNLEKYSLNFENVFNPCVNISAGAAIYLDCFNRALVKYTSHDKSMLAAFSCYYSGNFTRGFIPDKPNRIPYVDKVSSRYYGLKNHILVHSQK